MTDPRIEKLASPGQLFLCVKSGDKVLVEAIDVRRTHGQRFVRAVAPPAAGRW